jgi:hypothetical protein
MYLTYRIILINLSKVTICFSSQNGAKKKNLHNFDYRQIFFYLIVINKITYYYSFKKQNN